MLKKVVIIGPESTGKSTLCEQLAKHNNTLWCPEYAREYLLKNGMDYSYDDLLIIAKGQIELEEKYIQEVRKAESQKGEKNSNKNKDHTHELPDFQTSHPLFIDTNMYVMKVWCEFVFDKCHQYILNQIAQRKYDLYLLCNTDLPWIKDELREYPDMETRQRLYDIYKNIMMDQTIPWVEISGNYDERLQKAIIAVDKLLSKTPTPGKN